MRIDDGLAERLLNKDVFDEYDNKGKCKDHILEQYKLYVEMADRISQRRQSANTFFLSINTVIVSLSGFVVRSPDKSSESLWLVFVGLAGLIISYTWYRLIRSYRDLNTGKFVVIHEIEANLPIKPYDAEWVILGEGRNKDLYLPFTHIETKVPWVFFTLYIVLILYVSALSIRSFVCALSS